MLIKTIHEMRIYMPSHAYKEIETRAGIYEDAEQTVLAPLLGTRLLRRLNEFYATLPPNAIVPRCIYLETDAEPEADPDLLALPMTELLRHAQRCIVYRAEEESADIDAVSRHNAGINLITADGFETPGKDPLKQYKDRLYKKTHEAIDRLLIFLEELAKDLPVLPAAAPSVPDEAPAAASEANPDSAALVLAQQQALDIVTLWRESRYYYLADGLLINTATRLQEFIDIQENRERFVQMLPDMRFIQRNYLRTELGAELFDRLLAAYRDGNLTTAETELVTRMQELLALYTQQRSRVFKFDANERRRIEDECIGLRRELLRAVGEWRKAYNDDGTLREPDTAAPACPPAPHPACDDCSDCCGVDGTRSLTDRDHGPYWGDKGNVFVMPGIY